MKYAQPTPTQFDGPNNSKELHEAAAKARAVTLAVRGQINAADLNASRQLKSFYSEWVLNTLLSK
jgi:hypothetical protein